MLIPVTSEVITEVIPLDFKNTYLMGIFEVEAGG